MENFNITYIRKCRACVELQAVWKEEAGDYYCNVNNTISKLGMGETIENSFWIPTLYQIFQVSRTTNKMKDFNDLTVLSKMRIAISSSCCNNYLTSQSMHDFWIMFWMYMEYGKEWNEGANKWT